MSNKHYTVNKMNKLKKVDRLENHNIISEKRDKVIANLVWTVSHAERIPSS